MSVFAELVLLLVVLLLRLALSLMLALPWTRLSVGVCWTGCRCRCRWPVVGLIGAHNGGVRRALLLGMPIKEKKRKTRRRVHGER